jgi:hypothetical protein
MLKLRDAKEKKYFIITFVKKTKGNSKLHHFSNGLYHIMFTRRMPMRSDLIIDDVCIILKYKLFCFNLFIILMIEIDAVTLFEKIKSTIYSEDILTGVFFFQHSV